MKEKGEGQSGRWWGSNFFDTDFSTPSNHYSGAGKTLDPCLCSAKDCQDQGPPPHLSHSGTRIPHRATLSGTYEYMYLKSVFAGKPIL